MSNEPPPLPTPTEEGWDPKHLEAHVAELAALAELMLGAAFADGKASWPERSALAGELVAFTGHKELPAAVKARIEQFDAATFDLAATCQRLAPPTKDDRVALLGLVARVTDADAELHPAERAYLQRVATLIGASDDELAPFIAED